MDGSTAKTLVEELERHGQTIRPDVRVFTDMLTGVDVPETSRFHFSLPDEKQEEKEDSYHQTHSESKVNYQLALRRIMINRNAEQYTPTIIKKAQEALTSKFRGAYSSDVLTRKLREDKDLTRMMKECGDPFSLLGKYKLCDYDNEDETLFTITRPILVIPGASEDRDKMDIIHEWENRNTTYHKHITFGMIPLFKVRIKPEEYLGNT